MKISTRVFAAAAAGYLVLRLFLACTPGYVNDVKQYKDWAMLCAHKGIDRIYEMEFVDYPPLYLYVLGTVGHVYMATTEKDEFGKIPDSTYFTFLVKFPHILFDVLLGLLMLYLVGRLGYWGRAPAWEWGRLAALIYWYNPAVLFGSAYWGQPDGIHSFLAVGALAAIARSRWLASGALLSAAGLVKPLAAPLVPLLALFAVIRGRLRGFLLAGLGGLALAVVAFIPYLITGRIVPVLRKVLVDVESMPYTSVNGHSIWWLLHPWQDANQPYLGPLTPKVLSLIMFLTAYVVLLVLIIHGRKILSECDESLLGPRLFTFAAAITATFFFLSTHMHENHLFMAIPFLVAVAGRSRLLAWLCAAASLSVCLNMMLHDPDLPVSLPGFLSAASPWHNPHYDRPYTWLQLVGSNLNAVLVAWIAGGSYVAALRTIRRPISSP